MHDIWGLYNLTPQRYLTQERLSHNLYRGLLHLRDRRNLLPFWDVVGASIKSIPTKYHTLGTTFTGSKSIIAAGVSRECSRVALFEDPRFSSSVITSRRSAVPSFSLTTYNKDSNFESYSNFFANFRRVVFLLCKAFRIILLFKIPEKISIFSGSHL